MGSDIRWLQKSRVEAEEEQREKKNLYLLQHHREGFMIHRLAPERQINTHWTVARHPRLSTPPPTLDLSASSISSLFPCFFPSVASIPVTSLTSAAQTDRPWTFILPQFLKANADVDTVTPRLLRLVLQISCKLFLLLRNVFDFLINAVICKCSNGSDCSQLTN